MSLESVVSAVSKYAPLVGTAIAGPAGSVIGELVASIFGGDIHNPDELAKKILSDPEAQQKLLALNYQHEDAILSLQVKDKDSARQREVEVVKATGKQDWILNLIAVLYTTGFFGYVVLLAIHPSADDKEIFHDLLNGYVIILSFFFGSAYQSVKGK